MKFSVIIPVLNEEAALKRLSSPRGADVELIIVDGGSRDGSLTLARKLADIALRAPKAGRAAQMHQGALAASGEILLFLHADTALPRGWKQTLEREWRAPSRPAATAFRLAFDAAGFRYRAIEALANFRNRLTRVPHGDQAISVEARRYRDVGGFPDVPLMEEYFLLRKLKAHGIVRILPDAVKTSARRYEANGALRNAARNAFLLGLFYLGVPPRALARLYK